MAKKNFKGTGADLFLSDAPVTAVTKNSIKALKINPEFKSLIPPLEPDEYAQLEENLIKNGIREAISLWNDTIIDGHNRYEIAQKYDLSFTTINYEFETEDEVIEWIVKNQSGRRNLSVFARVRLALKAKDIIAKKAKQNQVPKKSWEQKEKQEIEKIKKLNLSYEAEIANINLVKQNISKERRNYNLAQEVQLYFVLIGENMEIGSSNDIKTRLEHYKTLYPNVKLLYCLKFGEGVKSFENKLKNKFSNFLIGGEVYQYSPEIFEEIKKYAERESKRNNETDNIVAKMAGTSHDTVSKVDKILKYATPEIITKLECGDTTINKAYQNIKFQEEQQKTVPKNSWEAVAPIVKKPKLPNGKFDVIYANPPWENIITEAYDSTPQHLGIKLEDIKATEIPAERSAILFLWAIYPILPEALEVMRAWGFQYKSQLIWDKENGKKGNWVNEQHEILLIGTKGNFKTPSPKSKVSSVYREQQKKYSTKPTYFYSVIEQYFPDGKYLELFTQKRFNEKWTILDNQVKIEGNQK